MIHKIDKSTVLLGPVKPYDSKTISPAELLQLPPESFLTYYFSDLTRFAPSILTLKLHCKFIFSSLSGVCASF
jgi:hypothetical protein